jgi:hypothetical protein
MKQWTSGFNWDQKGRDEDFRFRYLHDPFGKIIVTVCYKRLGDDKVAYGTAVTSPVDCGSKEGGRYRSYFRLQKALATKGVGRTKSVTLTSFGMDEYGYDVNDSQLKAFIADWNLLLESN